MEDIFTIVLNSCHEEVRGKIKEIKDRKVVVSATVSAGGEICAKGEIVTVKMPERLIPTGKAT